MATAVCAPLQQSARVHAVKLVGARLAESEAQVVRSSAGAGWIGLLPQQGCRHRSGRSRRSSTFSDGGRVFLKSAVGGTSSSCVSSSDVLVSSEEKLGYGGWHTDGRSTAASSLALGGCEGSAQRRVCIISRAARGGEKGKVGSPQCAARQGQGSGEEGSTSVVGRKGGGEWGSKRRGRGGGLSKVVVVCGGRAQGSEWEGEKVVGRAVTTADAHVEEEEVDSSVQHPQQQPPQPPQDPLLVRVARGEDAERTPVWLMRQAGRYMAEFRKFSDKLPFRTRSETADIAIELSLQPWRAFKPDGVIMFSDILTPLPALGIDFDVLKGKGPRISNPVRSMEAVQALRPMEDPHSTLPFVSEILSTLRKEVAGGGGGGGGGEVSPSSTPAVLGFIGTPWTLAAYSMEGGADRHLTKTKQIMTKQPAILHGLLQHLTDALIVYVIYQIKSGAQVVQLFDSWAHHLSPSQFADFSLPYAEQVVSAVKKVHPEVPLIFHANGGAGKLHLMGQSTADVLGLDWWTDMKDARANLGSETVLQGNVDPMVLFGTEDVIRSAVAECFNAVGGRRHILNVGHGVVQGTPEESVKLFCDLAKQRAYSHL